MDERILILAGHYGSGKTNLAINFALSKKQKKENVSIADLDIVNPYFRTKDSEEILKRANIPLISSDFANSNLDVPALPQEMYAVVDDRSRSFVLDVGGDDRGALALGRLSPSILEENSYKMILVANFFRPLTPDPVSLLQVVHEIETASGIPFTEFINNSNLGVETTPEDILSSDKVAREFSELSGLKFTATSVRRDLVPALTGKLDTIIPIQLQKKYYE